MCVPQSCELIPVYIPENIYKNTASTEKLWNKQGKGNTRIATDAID